MKKFLMLFAMVVMGFLAIAQTTPKISYQAVVRDANNRLVTNENVSVEVTIGSFVQTFASVQTNANGLISLQIGDASAEYSSIDWSTATIQTKLTILSNSEIINNTVPVTAVPFALNAGKGGLAPADSAAIYAKIYQDSVDIMATNVPMRINDTAEALRIEMDNAHQKLYDTLGKYTLLTVLADTAAQLRTDLKVNDDTLFLKQGVKDLGFFTANAASNITIDVQTKFTHPELVDSVKNFLAATTEAEMADLMTAISSAPQYQQFSDSVADLVAEYAINYHDRMVALGTKVMSDYAANTTITDFMSYYDSVKKVLSLVPAANKAYFKAELKARLTSDESKDYLKELISTLLTDPTFKSWITGTSSGLQPIVISLLGTSAVQTAVTNMIITQLGGNPATDDISTAVEKMMIVKFGGDPATDDIHDAVELEVIRALGGNPATDTIEQAVKNVLPTSVTIEGIGTKGLTW